MLKTLDFDVLIAFENKQTREKVRLSWSVINYFTSVTFISVDKTLNFPYLFIFFSSQLKKNHQNNSYKTKIEIVL